jgi:L-amino acid N-acyltransferase YncA
MNIRVAQEKDICDITDIYNEAIQKTVATFDTENKSVEDRRIWFMTHNQRLPIWVCESEGKIIGWSCISLWSDRCAYSNTVENSVYVREACQGQGCGKALMKTLVDFSKSNSYHTVIARISDGNQVSISLHETFGFQTIGIMKEVGFKFGRKIDVYLMQLLFS